MKKLVCHIITGLNQGGAESVLYKLVSHPDYKNNFQIIVISLQGPGLYAEKLRQAGVEVYCLNASKWNAVFKIITLFHLIKKLKPNIVQTWMYHANFLGGFASRWAGCKKIIWGIRDSGTNLSKNTRIINLLCAKLSWIPTSIVTPSVIAMQNHIQQGYDSKKFSVIPNGIDLSQTPSMKTAPSSKEVKTIGMLARYDPQKDFAGFLRAIHIMNKTSHSAPCQFLLAGRGVDQSTELKNLCEALNLHNVTLLPAFANPKDFYERLDLFVLSSAYGEAFPNVVAEAMACGLPCIVTNVGDAGHIVGDTGLVVAPKDPKALADACIKLSALSQVEIKTLGESAKKRIEENFTLEKMILAYCNLYQSFLEK